MAAEQSPLDGSGCQSGQGLSSAQLAFRYARIYDGPDEVHRMTVARRLLKDPIGNAPW